MNISIHKEVVSIYSKYQLIMICSEEIAELIEQLSNRNKNTKYIAEEVCDVIISIKRIELMLNIRLKNNLNLKSTNNYEYIRLLSKMQKCLSKYFRNNFIYNDVFLRQLELTKAVVRSLILKYDIEEEVDDWIVKKELRTKERIAMKILK